MNILLFILTFFLFILFTFLLWRFLSIYWSLPCPSWLSFLVEMENPFTKISRAETVIKNLYLKPGMNVLDAGCGSGRITIPLAIAVGKHGSVTACDMQINMLTKVQKRVVDLNLDNIRLQKASLGDGSLEKEKYDRIVLVTVLGEIPDKEKALRDLYKSLKPGGILSITEVIFDPHFQRKKTVENFAQKVGFKEKEFFGNYFAYTILFEK